MPLIFDDETPNSFEGDDYVFTMLDAETREAVRCVISREGIQRAIQRKNVYDPRIAFAMLKAPLGDWPVPVTMPGSGLLRSRRRTWRRCRDVCFLPASARPITS